jgi:hypothetical protein
MRNLTMRSAVRVSAVCFLRKTARIGLLVYPCGLWWYSVGAPRFELGTSRTRTRSVYWMTHDRTVMVLGVPWGWRLGLSVRIPVG